MMTKRQKETILFKHKLPLWKIGYRKTRDAIFKTIFRLSPGIFYSWLDAYRSVASIHIHSPGCRPFDIKPQGYFEYSYFLNLLWKEKDTIAWIDGFPHDTVLFDVGANVGIYSCYALARHPDCRVIAIEPECMNFARLVDNLQRTAPERAVAYAVGLARISGAAALEQKYPGAIGMNGNQVRTASHLVHGLFVFTLDEMVRRLDAFPTHIKIDVDGLEGDILEGAGTTLSDPRLRSILIEVLGEEPDAHDALMAAHGLVLRETLPGGGNRIFDRVGS